MRPITNEDIKILGRLVNISTEGVVADASQVYDSTQRKNQEAINSEMKNKTKNATTTTYGIVRLASGKNDADNTDVPTIKILRDAIQDAIDGILEDPNHTLQDQLNSIRELANAINNDASFYTTIQNWLAQKADKSAFDTLKGRVDDLAERVAYLEECCEQVHQYMDEFSITWGGAGSSHVRISPAVLRAGTNTAVCTIDNGWHCSTPLTRSNVLGDYDTITQTGTDTNIQLVFTGVRSNIVINAPITKTFFNITKHVIGTDSTDTYPFEVVYSGTHANAQTIAAGTALNLTVTGKTDRDAFVDDAPVSITIGDQAYEYSWLDHPYTTIDWLNGEPHSITIQIPASDINGDIELFFNGWHESSARLFVQISPNPNVGSTPGWQMSRPQHYWGSGSNPGYRDTYDGYSESVKGFFVNLITGDLLNPDMWPISATSALQTKLNNNDPSAYRLKSSTGYEGRTGFGIFTVSNGPNKTAITNILNVLFFVGGSWSGNLHMVGPNNINDDTDYTVTIETEPVPAAQTYSISYVGMTGRFHATNTATSVVENEPFSTDFIREAGVMPGASMTATNVTMGGVDITTQATAGSHDVDIDHVTGNVVITVQESDPFMFDGEITIDVPNGSASPDTLWADGTSQTSTITPNSGYTLTGATVSSDNNEVTASINGSTLTVSGQSYNNTTITVTLPAESAPTPNYGKAFINVVNAKLQPDAITSYTGPNDAANPQLPEYWTTYDGAKSVYSINSDNASTYKVMIEPPYDYMDPLDDSAGSYDYLVTVDVRDANGNKVCTYTDSPNNNFYSAYGENEVVSNTIVNLQKSANNSASDVLSGNIRYRKGSSIADRDENGDYTRAYRYIELNNIQSSIDLYITVTFYAGTGFTNYSRYMGHNNKISDDYVFSREAFSFNALGKYIDPMLPYDPSALDPNSQDTYFDVYGTPSYGNAYREINIGSINNIAGIAGSNESEKLADLKNKVSFVYIKKFGLENGVEHKYNDFINTETSPNCPFTISASDITLDSNNNAILKVYCSATNPNNEIITDTYLCPTSFQYTKSGSTVSFKTTTIDQHIKDSYHVDQLIVMCDTTPIYTTRLVREIYGLIAISPNRNQPGTTFSETVWKPNRYYYLSPSTIFTAESGDTTSPDLQVDFYEHGTQTPASNMEYSISEHYIDAVITIDPVDNTYPSLTSKLENVDMVDGAPSIEINKMTIATS